MTSLARHAEILNTEIKRAFGDLELKGFQFYPASIKHTDAIGDYVEVLASNQTTGKGLSFMYAPAANIRPESMSIFLQNDRGDIFSISDFLAYRKMDTQLRKSMALVNYDGTLEEKLAGALNSSKEFIFQYLDVYLLGSDWISIPIQWGDLK